MRTPLMPMPGGISMARPRNHRLRCLQRSDQPAHRLARWGTRPSPVPSTACVLTEPRELGDTQIVFRLSHLLGECADLLGGWIGTKS